MIKYNENASEIIEKSFNYIKINKKGPIKLKKTLNTLIKLIICISFIFSLILFHLIYLNLHVRDITLNLKEIIKGSNISKHKAYSKDYNILDTFKKAQDDFCENPSRYFNQEYENDITLANVKFNSINTKMYLPKSSNWVLYEIKKSGSFENRNTNFILEALKYYRYKKNIIDNKEIVILDIGGNVGWYPTILGRYNFTIISFEPFKKNNYISMKNYCYLNKNSNVYIVTKGLGSDNQICNYFGHNHNTGNGMAVCQKKNNLTDKKINKRFSKISEVEIITLNTFIPFLSNKSVALIKIDVEGNEFRVIEGGKELISKYHVPFVVLEFTPIYLKELGSEPVKLIQFFIDNGYKLSIDGFLSKNYIAIEELFAKIKVQINCYFIHSSIIY